MNTVPLNTYFVFLFLRGCGIAGAFGQNVLYVWSNTSKLSKVAAVGVV